jgi:hypothetical protein
MLKPSLLATFLLAAAALTGVAQAAAPARAYVDNVAAAIEENFYDAARARQIADDLRKRAASGEYDKLVDNRDLATTLTDQLKPLDRHFSVVWSPTSPASSPRRGEGPPHGAPSPDLDRRANYGIRRVEVQPGNIGYIDLRQFADFEFDKPDQPARKAIEAALDLVAGTDALIIDLRNNGGGSPAMVGYLSSAFTPKGADIYNTFHYRQGTASEAPADWYAKPRLQTPLYLLVSARTGSAAEAFAYTLKNAKRAVIVGEASAGAANPGGQVDAGNGFGVFVSSGSPLSPITHTNWEGDGVQPDVAATPATAPNVAKALALETVLKQTQPANAALDSRWALEALRAETTPPKPVAFGDYVGSYGALVIGQDGTSLYLQRGRRPAALLTSLGDDLFTLTGEPGTRIHFERDPKGAVSAFETRGSDGSSSHYRRGG